MDERPLPQARQIERTRARLHAEAVHETARDALCVLDELLRLRRRQHGVRGVLP
ncbi:hypothetical protein H4F76_25870, partial [Enterobacter hormaechei]|nr:hypothetical protein [Enterobacter hormaechei]